MSKVSVDEIKDKIKTETALLMDTEADSIGDDDLLVEDLGANSVIIVQLYSQCQDEFGIDLSESLNLSEPLSIKMLAQRVYDQINGKSGS